MGLTDKIGIAILCAFVLFSVVRLFAAPLRLAAKVLLNTALGFLALFLLGLTEPVTGFSLGLNFFQRAHRRHPRRARTGAAGAAADAVRLAYIFSERPPTGGFFHLSSPPTPQP